MFCNSTKSLENKNDNNFINDSHLFTQGKTIAKTDTKYEMFVFPKLVFKHLDGELTTEKYSKVLVLVALTISPPQKKIFEGMLACFGSLSFLPDTAYLSHIKYWPFSYL